MFYYLNGTITLLDANLAVVDCGGVGYACHTTNYTLARLQLGKPAKLFTYCNIKEDAFDIFGFSTREELNCFERLLGVTGVGPKAALAILSVVSPEQLTLAVMTQDDKTITMAQGVGKKLAQRIICIAPRFACIFGLRLRRFSRKRFQNTVKRPNDFSLVAHMILRQNLACQRINAVRQAG